MCPRFVLVVLLAIPLPAEQSASVPVVTLDQLVSEVAEKNPEIRAARYRYDAALKRPPQAGALPDPKVSLTNMGMKYPFGSLNRDPMAYYGIGITQEFPWPGKLGLASEEARKEAEQREQLYGTTTLENIARLKVSYFEWYLARKEIEVTNRNREVLDRFEQIARGRYEVGRAQQQDVLRAQLEISALVQRLELLNARLRTVEAQITALLNRAPGTPLGVPAEISRSPLTLTAADLPALIERESPRLKAAQKEIETRAVGVDRARKDLKPDFAVRFEYRKSGLPFSDGYMLMGEMSIPLWASRKQRMAIEEARAETQAARSMYQAAQQELNAMARELFLTAQASGRLLETYSTGVIPQARLTLESTISGYEVGNMTFLDLLTSFMSVLNFELEYYEQLTRHEQALARLEPLVGQVLTR